MAPNKLSPDQNTTRWSTFWRTLRPGVMMFHMPMVFLAVGFFYFLLSFLRRELLHGLVALGIATHITNSDYFFYFDIMIALTSTVVIWVLLYRFAAFFGVEDFIAQWVGFPFLNTNPVPGDTLPRPLLGQQPMNPLQQRDASGALKKDPWVELQLQGHKDGCFFEDKPAPRKDI